MWIRQKKSCAINTVSSSISVAELVMGPLSTHARHVQGEPRATEGSTAFKVEEGYGSGAELRQDL